MRSIWSEVHKRRLWRKIWVALAEVQAEFGLVQTDQVEELRARVEEVDIDRALEIEAEIRHDLMAEIKVFAEQCPHAGGIIHLGATSVDIKDNATALQIRQSLNKITSDCKKLLGILAKKIERYAETPLIAFTHLQPAEPSTLGYRFAQYGQDLLDDWERLVRDQKGIRGKGFKGAVGTSASYQALMGAENIPHFEEQLSQRLGLAFFPITTQVYPRKQDYLILSDLAGLGATIYKFAFDLRNLQNPFIGELSEPFDQHQVGSSTMPFKRNPVDSEKLNSLARLLAQFPRVAWDNAAHSLLERTLDDSANRRSILPEAFLISDELLGVATRILENLIVDEAAMESNLATYWPFAASEHVLMALTKAGADRQVIHERLRKLAGQAWEKVQSGKPNPLPDLIFGDSEFVRYLPESELRHLMDTGGYQGEAHNRARAMAARIQDLI